MGSCLAVTLTKLVIKTKRNLKNKFNEMAVDTILIICAMMKNGKRKQDQTNKNRMIAATKHSNSDYSLGNF